ncbi:hypothetical protein [Tabrizicola sp.]|uniref:P-type ATPase n=1 Tax=Tabrizicola sp. TaxID=2005166 RepID=UPI00386D6520
MSDLLSRVPRTAARHQGGALEEVPLDAIARGDLLLIHQGDVAPVDGTVESDRAILDQLALTGESLRLRPMRGKEVMRGSTNAAMEEWLIQIKANVACSAQTINHDPIRI